MATNWQESPVFERNNLEAQNDKKSVQISGNEPLKLQLLKIRRNDKLCQGDIGPSGALKCHGRNPGSGNDTKYLNYIDNIFIYHMFLSYYIRMI